MKKLLSFALILAVCCSSALLFAGCSSVNGTLTLPTETISVTISEEERKDEIEYMKAIDRELAKVTGITVVDNDGTTLFAGNAYEARLEGASITGFSLRNNGTRTARFAMYGVAGTFTYTVTTASAS